MASKTISGQMVMIARTTNSNLYAVSSVGEFVLKEHAEQGDNLAEWWDFPCGDVPKNPGLYQWVGFIWIDDGRGYFEPADAYIRWTGEIRPISVVGLD